MKQMNPSTTTVAPGRFRRLKWNERVRDGDFVKDNREGFEPWDGPRGFRADSFVKQIYRRLNPPPVKAGKPPEPAGAGT